jgi:hypothetical protein
MKYEQFIETKKNKIIFTGVPIDRDDLHNNLFEYQKDLVYLALKKGHFAIFASTGTGKTAMQCEWANKVYEHTQAPVLIVAPLAVAHQTIDEAKKILGLSVTFCADDDDVQIGVNITNYEKLHHFDLSQFSGVVLDESSILKSFTGKVRNQIVNGFMDTPFKLACSATPAPNDFVELGNHVEFLNICRSPEMLSMFFINDVLGDEGKWRLKKHAEGKFWEFVADWAAVFTKPSDLGYDISENAKYSLPKKITHEHIVESPITYELFASQASSLSERRSAKRNTLEGRCKLVADMVNDSSEIWLVWCELNDESAMLKRLIPDSVEVSGSDSESHKTKSFQDFAAGKIRVMISKAKIAGFGMNFQVCHNMAFVGLSDSFESIFQAERRCYRFGQKQDVNVHFVIAESEGAVKANVERKERQFLTMIDELIKVTKTKTIEQITKVVKFETEYNPAVEMKIPGWLE